MKNTTMLVRSTVFGFFTLFLMLSLASFLRLFAQDTAFRWTINALINKSIDTISVENAGKLLGQNAQHFTVLDAREKREYEVSHLNHAIWVGYDEFSEERVKALDLSRPILIYCSVGYRSEKIAEKLKALGAKEIVNLYGGIFEWSNQGLPLLDSQGKPTKSVHAYSKAWGVWLKDAKKVYD